VGSGDGNIYAINPNGTQKWAFPISGSPDAIGGDGTIYVRSGDTVYAINPNGTQKWAFPTGGYVSPSAIGADGTIYVGSNDNNVYAINPNGTLKWAFPTPSYQFSSPFSSPAIGTDGTIYVASWQALDSGEFFNVMNAYAIKPDGTQKWALSIENWWAGSSPAIGADGTIYFGSGAINPNGTLKGVSGTIGGSSPAIGADGTLYVGTDLSVCYPECQLSGFYAINTSSGGLANSAWPMFHHDVRHTGSVESGPVNVNYLLHFRADELATTYNPTPVPNGPAGTFVIVAKFDNTSDKTIVNPFFEVIQLTGGNLLLNADGGPGGVGATMTPPGSLTTPLLPGETGTYQFRISLLKLARFDFSVSMLGEIE
jgi:outer membrane protein assembly factor BamB